jgi:hypothetical protein
MSRIARALAALVIIVAVAGVGGLGALGVMHARDDVQHRAEAAVRDRARLVARVVHDTVADDLNAIVGTSSRPIVHLAMVFKRYQVVDNYFTELLAAHPRFVTAAAYDSAGRLVLRLPRDATVEGKLFRQQEYYSVARTTGLPHVSAMFVQLGRPKVPVIAYSIRVFHHGAIIGVLVGTTPITAFDSFVAPLTPSRWTARVYNAPGQLVSPSSEASGKLYTTDPIVGPALRGTSNLHRTHGSIVAAEPIPDFKWAAVVSEPASAVDADVRALTVRLSWYAGGAMLLALIAAVVAWRRRPAREA